MVMVSPNEWYKYLKRLISYYQMDLKRKNNSSDRTSSGKARDKPKKQKIEDKEPVMITVYSLSWKRFDHRYDGLYGLAYRN